MINLLINSFGNTAMILPELLQHTNQPAWTY